MCMDAVPRLHLQPMIPLRAWPPCMPALHNRTPKAQAPTEDDPRRRLRHRAGRAQGASGRAAALELYTVLGQDSSWSAADDLQTKRKRQIGRYASEEDAARAYDCAAVQARGPGSKRNFPGEDISELPVTVGEERKQQQQLALHRRQLAQGQLFTHIPSATCALGATPPRRTQRGRMTVRLCRRTDQVPSATSRARTSVSRLCHWVSSGSISRARATSVSPVARPALHGA
jgi:hypothetical protein